MKKVLAKADCKEGWSVSHQGACVLTPVCQESHRILFADFLVLLCQQGKKCKKILKGWQTRQSKHRWNSILALSQFPLMLTSVVSLTYCGME